MIASSLPVANDSVIFQVHSLIVFIDEISLVVHRRELFVTGGQVIGVAETLTQHEADIINIAIPVCEPRFESCEAFEGLQAFIGCEGVTLGTRMRSCIPDVTITCVRALIVVNQDLIAGSSTLP